MEVEAETEVKELPEGNFSNFGSKVRNKSKLEAAWAYMLMQEEKEKKGVKRKEEEKQKVMRKEEKKELTVTQKPGLGDQQVRQVIIKKPLVVEEDVKTEAVESVEKVDVEEASPASPSPPPPNTILQAVHYLLEAVGSQL